MNYKDNVPIIQNSSVLVGHLFRTTQLKNVEIGVVWNEVEHFSIELVA
jgi:hypothetical protein